MQLNPGAATAADIPFIESLLLAGARKGHFNPELLNRRDTIRQNLQSVVRQNRMLESPLYAEARIYKCNSQRTGFSIMTGVTDWPNAIELYAIGVYKTMRGNGFGRLILDELLHQWLPECNVYVRCAPASEQLYQMLLRRQFQYLFTMPSGSRVACCQQLPRIMQA